LPHYSDFANIEKRPKIILPNFATPGNCRSAGNWQILPRKTAAQILILPQLEIVPFQI
jgi:hypothetical protein